MDVRQFPMCCNAKVIVDFGGTDLTSGNMAAKTAEVIGAQLKSVIDERGDLLLVATTNNEQKAANIALKNAGFKCTKWFSKKKHSETKLRLWWRPPNV